ncbi:helix-turn-helix domain-containing protein [Roseovarius sp. PS-C2]|uniref:helix-turn-helix domain-containing protein n=1 Tax=Roseovarius sp. PS-C2 TaxID=2820814 RepID=UPI001C0D9791|nr:helix-turn-helix transcriptional regulator [Roseovarius sp. PS-C2]MBU3262091.1 helix-turn-helix domain-containing protein [Roseovarius sp. PS-C2]
MTYEDKTKLARTGDTSKEAAGIRLTAARKSIGLSQADLGKAVKVTKAAINNAESAMSYPSRNLMIYLYRQHRIDLNFMVCGDYAQLPGDIQDRLFEKLSEIENTSDQMPD